MYPLTAIPMADLDGNPATDVDVDWTPLSGVTPARPEYVSGHYAVSASAASVLAHLFGDKTAFQIDSERVPGVWRAFPSFSRAVLQVKDARVFAGGAAGSMKLIPALDGRDRCRSCVDCDHIGSPCGPCVARHIQRS